MVGHRSKPFSYTTLSVVVAADKPEEEEQDDSSNDGPFDGLRGLRFYFSSQSSLQRASRVGTYRRIAPVGFVVVVSAILPFVYHVCHLLSGQTLHQITPSDQHGKLSSAADFKRA